MLLVVLLVTSLGGSAGSLGASQDPRSGSVTCFGLPPTIWGTYGADTILGTAGADVIVGFEGNDTIWGMGGDDRICGDAGNDLLFGGPGRDRIQGGVGADVLYGEEGRDILQGGAGNNVLNGGTSVDRCFNGETYVSCELPAVDQLLAACPTKKEIARIDADLDLSFEADPTAGTLACRASQGSADLTPLQKRAYNAVRIMGRFSFDAALPWTSYTLYDWFTRTANGIRFRAGLPYSFCCEPAGVLNLQVGVGSQETDLWMRYDPFNVGIAHLMILMVHEARHIEIGGHTCNWQNGQLIDDNTIVQLGAWGVQYYLEMWLADHTSQAFLAGPAADRSFYQDQHRIDAQFVMNSRFCDE
jgi:hypothetical protein